MEYAEPPANAPGLYLKAPHGALIYAGKKSIIVKGRPFDFVGEERVLVSDNLAYGIGTLGEPEVVPIDAFRERFSEHRISDRERRKWWPDATELYLYSFAHWRPFEKPHRVVVPPGVQTLIDVVEWADGGKQRSFDRTDNPSTTDTKEEANMSATNISVPEGSSLNILVGQARPDPAPAIRTKEDEMPWTLTDPPSPAKNKAKAEKAACVAAANKALADGGTESDAIIACLGAMKSVATKEWTVEADHRSEEAQKALSHDDLRSALYDVLNPRYDKPETAGSARTPYVSIKDVYDNYLVIETDGTLFAVPYLNAADGLVMGTPVKGAMVFQAASDQEGAVPAWLATRLAASETAAGTGIKAEPSSWKCGAARDLAVVVRSTWDAPAAQGRIFAWAGFGGDNPEPAKARRAFLAYDSANEETKGAYKLPFADVVGGELVAVSSAFGPAAGRLQGTDIPPAVKATANTVLAAYRAKLAKQTEKKSGGQAAVDGIKGAFNSAVEALVDFIRPAEAEEENPLALAAQGLQGETGIKTFKALDGRQWILTWSMNSFQDREKEIFAQKAIEDYVERNVTNEAKGRFDFWHIPGSDFADIVWQGVSGRFLVEAGPFDDDQKGDAFAQFFQTYPEGHPTIAPQGWGTSPEYAYLVTDRSDGVYEWFQKSKTSVLPSHRAANPHNPRQEVFVVKDDQLKALKGIGGESLATFIVSLGEARTAELETQVAHKETPAPAATDVVAAPQVAAPAAEPTTAPSAVAAPAAAAPAPPALVSLTPEAKALADALQLDRLGMLIKGQTEAITGIATKMAEWETRMVALETPKAEEPAQDEKDLAALRWPWFRPSLAASTVTGEDATDGKNLGPQAEAMKKKEPPATVVGLAEYKP